MSGCPFGGAGLQLQPGEPIGLVAGWGQFPFAFARKAREVGLPVVCVALKGEADPSLAGLVSHFHWCGVMRLGRIIRTFKQHGVRRLVWAGKIHKANLMYRPWRLLHYLPDWRVLRFWFHTPRSDNRDDTILRGLIKEFNGDGLTIVSALDLCPELLVKPGVLTRRPPSPSETRDIEFGWNLARKMGELDIGQSVAVKDRAVLAVEAIEGTDRAILRAGDLCWRGGGFTVVKVAKPDQDPRFDVPTVGCTTIETMAKARGRVLAIEAGQTILLDPEQTIALADRLGITIVALTE
jgi:DUF1009 family protein